MTATFLTSNQRGNEDPAKPHIVLVGLPGSGKSTVGKLLADRLERSFLDFDVEVERREGRTVGEIFAADGEDYFRRSERALTEQVSSAGNMVLAPGGGWIADAQAVARLRPPARLVYLRVSPEVALQRMADDVAKRPLLRSNDPAGELWKLYAQREPYYMVADLHVDTEVITLQQLTDLLVQYSRVMEGA